MYNNFKKAMRASPKPKSMSDWEKSLKNSVGQKYKAEGSVQQFDKTMKTGAKSGGKVM